MVKHNIILIAEIETSPYVENTWVQLCKAGVYYVFDIWFFKKRVAAV